MNTDMVVNNNSVDVSSLYKEMNQFYSGELVCNPESLSFPETGQLKNNQKCFYRILKLSYDEEYPRREAFENVLLSMDDPAFNFVYILSGDYEGIELCAGVVKNGNSAERPLSAFDCGKILRNAFDGNFNGSELEQIRGATLENLLHEQPKDYRSAGVITGIPTINGTEGDSEYDFQGIDRLINSMLGLKWRLVVVCEPVSKKKIVQLREELYETYNRLSLFSKMTMQTSKNSGSSHTEGTGKSDSRGKNEGWSDSYSSGQSWNDGRKNESKQKGKQGGKSEDHSESSNSSDSTNKGRSESVTLEISNKRIVELLTYMDEELLERMKSGFSKGLYNTGVYYMAENKAGAERLRNCIMSLFQGNRSTYSPLMSQPISLDSLSEQRILQNYQLLKSRIDFENTELPMLYSRPFDNGFMGLSTYLTAKEICLFTGLPQSEVPGVALKESVNFGLNVKQKPKNSAPLGYFIQKGRKRETIPFFLDCDSFNKHIFVAGVTGSGKTTTCHKLLYEAQVPFLVIEPAKTEYRELLKNDKFSDIIVFTLGNETCAPFRLNPFELLEGEIISSHVDMLKATFVSAFPMEASMPQLLEETMYRCYEEKGWNIDTNENDLYPDDAYTNPQNFPTLSDLLRLMPTVVKEKNFGVQMQSDYIGSLVSRLSNLTVGSKGRMLNCRKSVDFSFILHHSVVLEMEDLKSPEDKAFLIGLILMRLSEIIKKEHKKNSHYRHITLVEEAHRLLSKPDIGDNGARKSAVETFTDLLAEVRKYGEGLVIVDQIPNKLAPEVLKNTNTKIIHKLLARDDKETVGDTMLMNDKQKEYLSALPTGSAVVFTENTENPVNIHIEKISDTDDEEIEQSVVKDNFDKIKTYFADCYVPPEVYKAAGKLKTWLSDLNIIVSNNVEPNVLFFQNRSSLIELVEHTSYTYSEYEITVIWKQIGDSVCIQARWDRNKADKMYQFITEIFLREDFSVLLFENEIKELTNTLFGYSSKKKNR